jgi:hypothetical protein
MSALGLPLSAKVGTHTWHLYSFNYQSQDAQGSQLSGYIYATSDDHARLLLEDVKATAVLAYQVAGPSG